MVTMETPRTEQRTNEIVFDWATTRGIYDTSYK